MARASRGRRVADCEQCLHQKCPRATKSRLQVDGRAPVRTRGTVLGVGEPRLDYWMHKISSSSHTQIDFCAWHWRVHNFGPRLLSLICHSPRPTLKSRTVLLRGFQHSMKCRRPDLSTNPYRIHCHVVPSPQIEGRGQPSPKPLYSRIFGSVSSLRWSLVHHDLQQWMVQRRVSQRDRGADDMEFPILLPLFCAVLLSPLRSSPPPQ